MATSMPNGKLAVSTLSLPPKISSGVEELKSLQVFEDEGKEGSIFPKACIFFLRTLPGNEECLSCGDSHPTFAHIPLGMLLCGRCKDDHIANLGASLQHFGHFQNDKWNGSQAIRLLLGGNKRLFEFIALQSGFVPQPLFSAAFYNHGIGDKYEELLDARSKEVQNNTVTSSFFDDIHPSGVNIYESSKRACHISIAEQEMHALSRKGSPTRGIARTKSRRDSQQSAESKGGSKDNKDESCELSSNSLHGGIHYSGKDGNIIHYPFRLSFPPSCMFFLRNLSGNDECVDCGGPKPDFGDINYGVLACRQCAETHLANGPKIARVKSLWTDSWTLPEVLAMMEGGNGEFHYFLDEALKQKECSKAQKQKIIDEDKEKEKDKIYVGRSSQEYRKQLDHRIFAAASCHGCNIPKGFLLE